MNKAQEAISKYLSYLLRHDPGSIGLELDKNGWTDIDVLIDLARKTGQSFDHADIEAVVKTNNKQRFEISTDGRRIRARQGHSVPIDLALEPSTPPDILYHGTAAQNLVSIRKEGLKKGARHDVHLSINRETAIRVGSRYGEPVVLEVQARKMLEAGFVFCLTANNVWLVERVPPGFLIFPSGVNTAS